MRYLLEGCAGAALLLLFGCVSEEESAQWHDSSRLQLIDCRDGRGKIIYDSEVAKDSDASGKNMTFQLPQLDLQN